MNDLIFTRLLYPYYDVLQSIYETFKSKTSFDETLFWISEAYFSMFYDDSFFMVYFLYFSFTIQYDNDNKLYNTIQDSHKKWKNSSLTKSKEDKIPTHSHFFKLFSKLYNSKYNKEYNKELIQHENSIEKQKLTVYRGNKPEFTNKVDKDLQNLLYSLHKLNHSNVWNYIEKYYEKNNSNLNSAFELLLTTLATYISSEDNIQFNKELNVTIYQNIFQYFKDDFIPCHYYLSISKLILLHILQSTKETNKIDKFSKTKHMNDEYLHFYDYKDEIIKTLNKPNYRLLKELRKYTLKLDQERDLEDSIGLRCKYYYHWVEYLIKCPLWKKRLLSNNAFIDSSNNTITFPDTDFEERFYEQYNYEPDEQEIGVTNMLLI